MRFHQWNQAHLLLSLKDPPELVATWCYSPSLYYLLLSDNGEPDCCNEALQVENSSKWEHLKIKEEHDGNKRYKARLVVKGFQQKEGVEFNSEIFSLVVKLTTVRLVYQSSKLWL